MKEKEALQLIGRLLVEARLNLGSSQIALARKAGVDVKTLRALEIGAHLPQQVQRDKIEKALGWRSGAIADIWHNKDGDLDLSEVNLSHMAPPTEPVPEEVQRANIAAQLTDAELLSELTYRFTKYSRHIEHENPTARDHTRGGSLL